MSRRRDPSHGFARLPRAVISGAAFIAVALVLAACGSSSSSSSSSAPAASTSSSVAASTTASASGCVASVTKLVSQETAPMPLLLPSTPVDMSKIKGKTIWYISPSQATGYALAVSQALTAAGNAAGVKISIFDGKGEPTLFTQGMSEAVAAKAAGIVLYGINPALVPVGLQAAKAAKIPVLAVLTGEPAPPNGTIFESINEAVTTGADDMADYAAYATGCKVNGATSFDSTYPSLVTERNTIKAEFAKICPSTCTVQDDPMSLATMATALAPNVESLIERNPKLNTIFATFDQAATYEIPAVQQSGGGKVKIVGTDGLPPNVDAIRKGEAQIADIAYVPPEYLGWLCLDQVARAILGKPTGQNGKPFVMPVQTLDKTNVGTSDTVASLFPKLANYEADFKAKWGL
jgi:ribose transport system substrate-binding protein